jgi:hypothetical protein
MIESNDVNALFKDINTLLRDITSAFIEFFTARNLALHWVFKVIASN